MRATTNTGLLLGLLLLGSCNEAPFTAKNSDIVASVGNHNLYADELPKLSDKLSTSADSAMFVNGYVEQWIRKTAIVLEAETSLGNTVDIEALVDNYRVSLLINNYQQKYVSERLDTSISPEDLEAEYHRSGEDFTVAESLYLIRIAKVDAKKSGLEGFHKKWKAEKEDDIISYCEANAEYCTSMDWLSAEEIHKLIPKQKFPVSKLKNSTNLQAYAGGYEYFVKIKERKDIGDKPPLAYIADKLTEIVIHRRKKALLSKLESDLYDMAMASQKIKVYKK